MADYGIQQHGGKLRPLRFKDLRFKAKLATIGPGPINPTGTGHLAGTYPLGITSVQGVPGPATIRVHIRAEGSPGDGRLVAQTTSAVDGTWYIGGLNTSLKYDVICRRAGFNDMILSNVSPIS